MRPFSVGTVRGFRSIQPISFLSQDVASFKQFLNKVCHTNIEKKGGVIEGGEGNEEREGKKGYSAAFFSRPLSLSLSFSHVCVGISRLGLSPLERKTSRERQTALQNYF